MLDGLRNPKCGIDRPGHWGRQQDQAGVMFGDGRTREGVEVVILGAAEPDPPVAPPPVQVKEPEGPGEEERNQEKKRKTDEMGDKDKEQKKDEGGDKGYKKPKAKARSRFKVKRTWTIFDPTSEESDEEGDSKI